MTKDEALKMALEALKEISRHYMSLPKKGCMALAAIEEALAQPEQCQCPDCKVTPHASDCAVHNEPAWPKGACNCGAQPEQEPVAWANLNALSEQINSVNCGTVYRLPSEAEKRQPLYTTPPQRKPWAGLTEQEHTDIAVECGCMSSDWVFYGATVERLLKEKNS